MKNTLLRIMMLSLYLFLSLQTIAVASPRYAIILNVADSAFAVGKPAIITATVMHNGIPAPAQGVAFTWHVKENPQALQPGPITTTNAIGQAIFQLQNMRDWLPRTITVRASLSSNPAISATADVDFEIRLPPRVSAISTLKMNLPDAIAFCEKWFGRLPRIEDSDSLEFTGLSGRNSCFGIRGTTWPDGVPSGPYWTTTQDSGRPGNSWFIHRDTKISDQGSVSFFTGPQSPRQVMCIWKW